MEGWPLGSIYFTQHPLNEFGATRHENETKRFFSFQMRDVRVVIQVSYASHQKATLFMLWR